MKWIGVVFSIYLWMIVWAQIDNSYRRPKEAVFNTFVAPWIYFFLAIPYYAYRGVRFVVRWFMLEN